jgi:hypothetical protein
MYMAYKYAVISILLIEANFCAKRLDLPVKEPILASDLTYELIAPVTTLKFGGAGGRIDAGGYSFSEGHHLHCFITKVNPFGDISTAEENRVLSRSKSLIDTNGAYRLATNWLMQIEVDVAKLERENRVQIRQRSWLPDAGSPAQPLPVFELRWGNLMYPKVLVSIDGRNKQLLYIRLHDQGSFSKRPVDLIKNITNLLSIPDDTFIKYSALQRSNLVAQYCGIVDSSVTNELPQLLSQISSIADAPTQK